MSGLPPEMRQPNPLAETTWLTGALPKIAALPGEFRYAPTGRTAQKIAVDDNVYLVFNGYAPGHRTPAHTHPKATKIYCVIEGTGHFSLNGEVRVLGSGDWHVARAGEPHGVYNPGPGNLGFLMLVTPNDLATVWVD